MKSLGLLLLTLPLVACSLVPNRTYLSEMEDDDSAFFQPREDFQVVAGDTGRDWRNQREWNRRTPASESTRLKEREDRLLEDELRRLESAQSEGAQKHYQQYRARLGSTSERIYFLQLKGKAEREEYLSARGLMAADNAVMPHEYRWAADQGELLLGMSKDDVESSWGRPERVDIAGNPTYENERWMYRRDGAAKYIFFEGGKVGGWSSTNR
jgi:hypothetical protein